jgi:signal transduction histidine kinase
VAATSDRSTATAEATALIQALILTHAAQVLALSNQEAKAKPGVQIRGMVTYYDPQGMALFVQDETGGVFVYHTGPQLNLKPGQYVEVSGLANRGHYSHFIDSPQIRRIETGPAITPRLVSLAEIYLGGLDAQWVKLTGVVREQKIVDRGLRLELAVPPQRINVWIPNYESKDTLQLEGSMVTVRGVVGTLNTDQGQRMVGFQIFVNTIEDLAIRFVPPADPFSTPSLLVRDLRTPALRMDGIGHVRIRGIVTLSWPGREVFIQDATGGLRIQTKEPINELAPGMAVEVAGFMGPVLEEPLLEDAVIRKLGTNYSPQPVSVLAEDLFHGRHNYELVETEATFLDWADHTPSRPALQLQSQGHFFTALMDLPSHQRALPSLQSGYLLRVRGVCCTHRTLVGAEPALSLLLRSPEDIRIIAAAPASARRVGLQVSTVVAMLAGAALMAALWYTRKQRGRTEHILQVQATLQAEMLQGEQQLRRSMEERDRIGRDLHDDIIQSIYAVGLNLEDCRRVIRQSPQHAEARLVSAIDRLNDTIRNVRGFLTGLESKVLNGREFKTALKSLVLTSGEGSTAVHIEVDPSAANSLTSVQATQLLHIAKEAMSNSLRHARASSVTVSLHPVSSGVRLEVRDNGEGFDLGAISGMGHGLRNMRVRAREIGADLQILSAPSQGCAILVSVPQRNSNESD